MKLYVIHYCLNFFNWIFMLVIENMHIFPFLCLSQESDPLFWNFKTSDALYRSIQFVFNKSTFNSSPSWLGANEEVYFDLPLPVSLKPQVAKEPVYWRMSKLTCILHSCCCIKYNCVPLTTRIWHWKSHTLKNQSNAENRENRRYE